MRQGKLIAISSFFGASGVLLGAFGAHALKTRIDERLLQVFETAVRYQMIHALALAIIAALYTSKESKFLERAAICFVIGITIFSGSLYALVASGIGLFGAVTPIGGVCLVMGWVFMGIDGFSRSR